MRSTFKYLFYINRNKKKKNGLCPVMGRITLDGSIAQFSTGLETAPDLWDAKAGLSTGKSLHELKVNRSLKELSKAIETHYARMVENGLITAERVKNAVLGIAKEPTTLLKEFEEATEEVKRELSASTIAKPPAKSYVNSYMNLSRFIKEKTKKRIYRLTSWSTRLLRITILFLKTENGMATGSVLQLIVFLRKMVKTSHE
jgi:hypothetical protein